MAEQILPEMQDITRQRDLAKMLMQRGMTDNLQGQMVSGRYVGASPWQGIANLYSAYKGKQLSEEADKKQAELADMLRRQTVLDIQAYGQTIKGKPAVEGGIYGPDGKLTTQTTPDMYGADMQLNPQYKEVKAQEAIAPDYDKGLAILMGSKSPQSQALAQALLADQIKSHILPEGGTLIRGSLGGGAGQTVTSGPKQTTDYKNYQSAVEGGYQGSFNDWYMQKEKAKGTNISVNTAKDLASQIGDIAKESRISATGAVQSADAANRIIQAVDTNKLFAGAGANQRLTAAQIADGLGLGGKDTAEKIANTRQAIQGLAQLTLQGRKQMRGEGAITESEGNLAQRAMSGDVTLTKGEIRQLAEAAKRSAKFQYGQHQNIMTTIKADPNARGLASYYDVPTNMDIFNPTPLGSQSNIRSEADKILGGQ